MGQEIVVRVGGNTFEAELNDTATGKAIYGALPIRAKGQRWGGEIYFSIGVSCELEENSRDVLEEGELVYWPRQGRLFAYSLGLHLFRVPMKSGRHRQ